MEDVILAAVKEVAAELLVENPLPKRIFFSTEDDDETALLAAVQLSLSHDKNATVRHQVTSVLQSCSDLDFKNHFRLSRTSVEHLTQLLNTQMPTPVRGRPPVAGAGETTVLLSLWLLANQESFRCVAERFGVGISHAHRSFKSFCEKVSMLAKDYLTWPTEGRMSLVLNQFEKFGETHFPSVAGCIDVTHIPIRNPNNESASYFNRRGHHSIILQGVCDAKKKFIDVYVGWPGAANDARVWKSSPLYKKLSKDPFSLLRPNTHLLGDASYPLEEFIMVPYKDNGYLSPMQKNFNRCLNSKHEVIEQCFDLLKEKFQRLNYLDVLNVEFAPTVVMAACVLHNLCILHSEISEEEDNTSIELAGPDYGTDANFLDASQKRDQIAYFLFA